MNALITGASRGIGRAIATKFAENGWNVIINYNNSRDLAENLAHDLEKTYHVKAYALQADVSKEGDCLKLIDEAYKLFPKLDALVNNAGICDNIDFETRPTSRFIKTFETNAFSVYYLSRPIGRKMIKDGGGKIVNVSSNNTFNSYDPVTIDYDASKCAVNSLTKNLAVALAPSVNVNAVAPGWVKTDMSREMEDEFIATETAKGILKNRIGTPRDVANLVYFLCSPDADYINGEIIKIDGGMR